MYADPKQVKDNRVPVYLSDYAHEKLLKLVEMQGGVVAAQSDGPGQGSEFVVRLPAAEPVADRAGDDAPMAPP